jgi:hypothetical protein
VTIDNIALIYNYISLQIAKLIKINTSLSIDMLFDNKSARIITITSIIKTFLHAT